MTGLEFERTQVETPRGRKTVKPGSGPTKLQAHNTDYEEMFSKFSPKVRRQFIKRMIGVAAAAPGRDLEELYLINSQTDGVTCLKTFDDWSNIYGRKIRTGEAATFLWEETTSPVCPCCDQPLYWHYQSGCDREGDLSSWDRRKATQPLTLFDYSQTITPTDATGRTHRSHTPWRVDLLSNPTEERAEEVLNVLDSFESNAGVSIDFVSPDEWGEVIEPASVDQNSAFFGNPAVSVVDSGSVVEKAQNVFYGLSASVYMYQSDCDRTTLGTLLLTSLLCEHYGIPSIETPHESYFGDDTEFTLDLVDDVLDSYDTLIKGVKHQFGSV